MAALAVASLTLIPGNVAAGPSTPFFCLLGCDRGGLRDLINNVVLFIAVGWVLRSWLPPRAALATCLAITVGIESLQAVVLVGRDSSLRDILANLGGGAIGIWLYAGWPRLLFATRSSSRRNGAVAAAFWACTLVATAMGLKAAPTARPWFGQWGMGTELRDYAPYRGALLRIAVGDWVPPDTLLPEPNALRLALDRGRALIDVVAVSGPRPPFTAPMFSVTDDQRERQILVGQDRRALRLEVRTRFDTWGLRGLAARLPLFPGRKAGDTVSVRAGIAERRWVIEARSGTEQQATTVPLTVGLGWVALLPIDYPVSNEWIVMNVVWLAALTMPWAYWLSRADPRRAIVWGIGLLGVACGLVPALTGAAPSTVAEWSGSATGGVLGWVLGALSRGRVP